MPGRKLGARPSLFFGEKGDKTLFGGICTASTNTRIEREGGGAGSAVRRVLRGE